MRSILEALYIMVYNYNHYTTNEVIIVIPSGEVLLDNNTFSISTSSKKQDFYGSKIYLFQFQYHQALKFLYPFLYMIINFYDF